MKIWGQTNSTYVRKVFWFAEELNPKYESIPAGGEFGLWESNVIVRYLAKKYDQESFAPTDIRTWYAAEKWID